MFAEIVVRLGEIGISISAFLESGWREVPPRLRLRMESGAETVVGFDVVWMNLQRIQELHDGRIHFAFSQQSRAKRHGVADAHLSGSICTARWNLGDCFIDFAIVQKKAAPMFIVGPCVIGIDLQRFLEMGERFGHPSFIKKCISEIAMGHVVVLVAGKCMGPQGFAVFPIPGLHPGANHQCTNHDRHQTALKLRATPMLPSRAPFRDQPCHRQHKPNLRQIGLCDPHGQRTRPLARCRSSESVFPNTKASRPKARRRFHPKAKTPPEIAASSTKT